MDQQIAIIIYMCVCLCVHVYVCVCVKPILSLSYVNGMCQDT